MRRAVILTTLILLLLAVAGVTAAQERRSLPPVTETIPEETIAPEIPDSTTEPNDAESAKLGDERPEKPDSGRPDEVSDAEGPEDERSRSDESRNDAADKREGQPGTKPKKSGGRPESAEKSGGNAKVTVCHKGKTLNVGAPAEGAHAGHGDPAGACGR